MLSCARATHWEAGAIDSQGNQRREIGRLIILISRILRQDFDRSVAHLGVTRSQWAMIAVVSRMPGTTQRKIAELLEMSEASAGRLIDRLCADGLLVRTEQDNDRRARAVHLTEKATPLLDYLGKLAMENESRVFNGFTDEELELFGKLLEKLRVNLTG
ncbi:MAG: MarR family winged helix-turn-helix transcriptional regulator [Novosphingobium sp.]